MRKRAEHVRTLRWYGACPALSELSDTAVSQCAVTETTWSSAPPGNFGAYRIWMTSATYNTWSTRGQAHNSPLDVTFVYGNSRVIYNAGAKFAGRKAFHQ